MCNLAGLRWYHLTTPSLASHSSWRQICTYSTGLEVNPAFIIKGSSEEATFHVMITVETVRVKLTDSSAGLWGMRSLGLQYMMAVWAAISTGSERVCRRQMDMLQVSLTRWFFQLEVNILRWRLQRETNKDFMRSKNCSLKLLKLHEEKLCCEVHLQVSVQYCVYLYLNSTHLFNVNTPCCFDFVQCSGEYRLVWEAVWWYDDDTSLTRCFECCPRAVYTEGQIPPLFVWLHKPSPWRANREGNLRWQSNNGEQRRRCLLSGNMRTMMFSVLLRVHRFNLSLFA